MIGSCVLLLGSRARPISFEWVAKAGPPGVSHGPAAESVMRRIVPGRSARKVSLSSVRTRPLNRDPCTCISTTCRSVSLSRSAADRPKSEPGYRATRAWSRLAAGASSPQALVGNRAQEPGSGAKRVLHSNLDPAQAATAPQSLTLPRLDYDLFARWRVPGLASNCTTVRALPPRRPARSGSFRPIEIRDVERAEPAGSMPRMRMERMQLPTRARPAGGWRLSRRLRSGKWGRDIVGEEGYLPMCAREPH